jgi:hypothetical protein
MLDGGGHLVALNAEICGFGPGAQGKRLVKKGGQGVRPFRAQPRAWVGVVGFHKIVK